MELFSSPLCKLTHISPESRRLMYDKLLDYPIYNSFKPNKSIKESVLDSLLDPNRTLSSELVNFYILQNNGNIGGFDDMPFNDSLPDKPINTTPKEKNEFQEKTPDSRVVKKDLPPLFLSKNTKLLLGAICLTGVSYVSYRHLKRPISNYIIYFLTS